MDKTKRYSLLAAAKQLCDLMYHWNVVDLYELVVDNPGNGGSAYHHTTKALERILGHLGLDETSTFYDLIIQGQSPEEALETAMEIQADRIS